MLSTAARGALGKALNSWAKLGSVATLRGISTEVDLKSAVAEKIPEAQESLKELKSKYGNEVLGQSTVAMAIGGMRGIPGLLWETSLLDADEGIRFRGYSIPECQQLLPSTSSGHNCTPGGTAHVQCSSWQMMRLGCLRSASFFTWHIVFLRHRVEHHCTACRLLVIRLLISNCSRGANTAHARCLELVAAIARNGCTQERWRWLWGPLCWAQGVPYIPLALGLRQECWA